MAMTTMQRLRNLVNRNLGGAKLLNFDQVADNECVVLWESHDGSKWGTHRAFFGPTAVSDHDCLSWGDYFDKHNSSDYQHRAIDSFDRRREKGNIT